MAELTAFTYRYRPFGLYKLDARFKLAALACMSISTLTADVSGLFTATLAIMIIFGLSKLSFWRFVREARFFLLLLGCILLSRALITPGKPLIQFFGIIVSRQGLYEGGLICWRLFLIVSLSISLTATTRSAQIRWAVAWYLFPLPATMRHRISIMIGLLVRFLPVILHQSRETALAQKARGIENRGNPASRLTLLCMPLLRRVFASADQLAMAMTSRCYNEQTAGPQWQAVARDWVFLFSVICTCLLIAMV